MHANTIDHELAAPIWIDRFGTRLMELRPRISAVTAGQLAAASYSDSSDLDPEDAAEIFAAVGPIGDEGRPYEVDET